MECRVGRSLPVLFSMLLVAEVLLYVGAFAGYIWIALPDAARLGGWNAAFALFAVGFPICMNLLHGDRPRDSGIRLDTLGPSSREVGLATLAMAGGISLAGMLVGGWHWNSWPRLAEQMGLYVAWGLLQQYLLQAFALRRLLQARLPAVVAVPLAAGLFAAVHAPNWPLVAVTAGSGVIWCVLFLRRPNLLPLGLAHAALAVLVYHAWPRDWHYGLAIGPEYLQRVRDVAKWGWP